MSEEKRETKQALLGELESIKDLLSEDEWDDIPVLSDTVSEPSPSQDSSKAKETESPVETSAQSLTASEPDETEPSAVSSNEPVDQQLDLMSSTQSASLELDLDLDLDKEDDEFSLAAAHIDTPPADQSLATHYPDGTAIDSSAADFISNDSDDESRTENPKNTADKTQSISDSHSSDIDSAVDKLNLDLSLELESDYNDYDDSFEADISETADPVTEETFGNPFASTAGARTENNSTENSSTENNSTESDSLESDSNELSASNADTAADVDSLTPIGEASNTNQDHLSSDLSSDPSSDQEDRLEYEKLDDQFLADNVEKIEAALEHDYEELMHADDKNDADAGNNDLNEEIVIDDKTVDVSPLDELSMDELSLDELSLDELSLDEPKLDQLALNELPIDEAVIEDHVMSDHITDQDKLMHAEKPSDIDITPAAESASDNTDEHTQAHALDSVANAETALETDSQIAAETGAETDAEAGTKVDSETPAAEESLADQTASDEYQHDAFPELTDSTQSDSTLFASLSRDYGNDDDSNHADSRDQDSDQNSDQTDADEQLPPGVLPGQQSLFTGESRTAKADGDEPYVRPERPTRATGENPFLPKHIRDRLHTNKTLVDIIKETPLTQPTAAPKPEAEPVAKPVAEQVQEAVIEQLPPQLSPERVHHMVEDVIALYMPRIEAELRERLLVELRRVEPDEGEKPEEG
ncbi:MAG: hypothetical protein ACRBBW_15285 [Cellvibrionaceae bacterium]